MSDVVVSLLLENLVELLRNNKELIFGVKDEAENLVEDLKDFNAFLKQAAAESRRKNVVLETLVKKIRRVVNAAEDAIDKLVIEVKLHKDKGPIVRSLDFSHYNKVKNIAQEIKGIRDEVKQIRSDNDHGLNALQDNDLFDRPEEERKVPAVEEDDVVGFDQEAKQVIDRLLQGSEDLVVVPVLGMPGLGKTTLAKMIFKDSEIDYEFFIRVWVYVSQSFKVKELYLDIISKIKEPEKYQNMSEDGLAYEVRGLLKDKKYLIVLDDVWTGEDWDRIKKAFPNNKNGNRVLLTTRNSSVAQHCNIRPHNLKFLTHKESWILLEKKVFHKDKCPVELVDPGESIARKCNGLPLAVVVIAGALLGKGKTPKEWKEVDQSVGEKLLDRDQPNNCDKLVRLSYDRLSYDMKACFLYFGAFPRAYEIPAWKLIRLWISEGFIQYKGPLTLESKAHDYLNDLVNRNLVMVTQWTSDGQIKTCRVHDMLHEFCFQEAVMEENLFYEVKFSTGEQSFREPQQLSDCRRLCIHSSVLKFISNITPGLVARSFLCFSSEEEHIPTLYVRNIPKAFPWIRVLDAESIEFSSLCKDFFQLYHLRYIAFSCNMITSLPKRIGELWNVQTIIVKTQQSHLDILTDIWNMPGLRHLHTNTSAKLPTPVAPQSTNKVASVNQCLQTLSTIAPESCTEEVFSSTPNLKKLGVRGKMEALLLAKPNKSELFNNVKALQCLEKMKLINVGSGRLTGKQLRLPPSYIFPSKLRKLTLVNTYLEWGDMSVLGQLDYLEVLKLKNNAFMGGSWQPKYGGFPSLLVLWVERTELVSWNASADHFPRLKRLVLISCTNLEEIPIGLADIRNFQLMELQHPTKKAAKSARDIKAKKEEQPEEEVKTPSFKLIIFPPDL